MEQYAINRIGVIKSDERGCRIVLEPRYAPGLAALEGFGHLSLLWWFSGCDNAPDRAALREESPYRAGPRVLGVFATRSPRRPNPIALSTVEVTYLDAENAVIGIAWTDADDNTPVLDIKPYTPSIDRVERPRTPEWCAHWPQSYEASGAFDWEAEFNV